MNRSTAKPTHADLERFAALRRLGCFACHVDGRLRQCAVTEIHHQLRGGKRIGHHATIPLGRWHHQGVANGTANEQMLATYGPSFHKHTRAFRERYGTDAEVLAQVNDLIGATA